MDDNDKNSSTAFLHRTNTISSTSSATTSTTSTNELRERKVTFNPRAAAPNGATTRHNYAPPTVPRITIQQPIPKATMYLPTELRPEPARLSDPPPRRGRVGSVVGAGAAGAAPGGRKFSFPAALHANLLGLAGRSTDAPDPNKLAPPELARRRFSNVSDAVSRKLSTTISGWRAGAGGIVGGATPPPVDEVAAQGRVLCGHYIRNRLRRGGFYGRKLGLYRLRSMIGTSSALIIRDVYPALATACSELERQHPKLYTNISRLSGRSSAAAAAADRATTAALLSTLGHHLLHAAGDDEAAPITWGRIIAVYSIAGGLAVDCVCQGRVELLQGVMEGMAEVLEGEEGVAEWVAHNGGWPGLSSQCKFPEADVTYREYATIVIIAVAALLVVYFIIRLFFKIGLF